MVTLTAEGFGAILQLPFYTFIYIWLPVFTGWLRKNPQNAIGFGIESFSTYKQQAVQGYHLINVTALITANCENKLLVF